MSRIPFTPSAAAAFALALALTGAGRAEEAKKPWSNLTDASVVTTNGNSKTTTIAAKNTFTYNWTRQILELVAGGLGSQERGSTTAEQYMASQKYTYKFTEENYAYERFAWDSNRFSGYYNRYDGSIGLGRYLLDLPRHQWTLEAGGGYAKEQRVTQPNIDNATGRGYTKYIWKITETSAFSQDVEYLHNFDDSDAYRLNTETALTAAVSSHVSLKTAFAWNRVAIPAPGAVKDDTRFTAGLQVRY